MSDDFVATLPSEHLTVGAAVELLAHTPQIRIVQYIPQTRRRREHRVPVDRGGNRARSGRQSPERADVQLAIASICARLRRLANDGIPPSGVTCRSTVA